ncbi:MraY family glycosyltransferase [Boudabousia marimammalium]|uniref:Undecaprenyl-phosphate alpha-N-acetylglucosaminyl 1-phosphate transferase n=1 Tax=Boudabousia marimammalium TaxID=156892 RepID=A0A1Q5PRD6_9ACTO|nr:MraY family glycosyltransferase [Boudabousia marimammalium]OKL50168.1 undecaprenyl-phosphate alpha-N-acetylglucosaminyl 1-phosphate transferase [Boudabousia marimammalium]
MRVYLLILLIAVAFTALVTPIIRRLTIMARVLTPVRDRDVHAHPIPRLGGVAMTVGFTGAMLMAYSMPYLQPIFDSSQAWPLIWATIAMCALGVTDDIWDLDWYTKLAGQFIIVGAMAWQGVQLISFPVFGVTIGSARLSALVTVIVVVAAVNAVNFVDGLDGLAAGTLAIGAAAFFTYSYFLTRVMQAPSYASLASLVCVALVGICIGFLLFNFHPASIFMGDSGAMVLGLIVASAGIIVSGQIDPNRLESTRQVSAIVPILLPFAVLFIPLLDMTLAVFRRTLKGKSPFYPDTKHLHHRLLRLGHSHTRVVLLLYVWSAVVAFCMASLVVLSWWQMLLILVPSTVGATVLTVGLIPSWRRRVERLGKEARGKV